METWQFWAMLVTQAGVAAGVYAAVRADLREALVRSKDAQESADKAHSRIDQLQTERR